MSRSGPRNGPGGRFGPTEARRYLADELFRPSDQDRIGVEVEFLPLARDGLTPVPIVGTEDEGSEHRRDVSGLLTLLRAHADRSGWVESTSAYGAPRFHAPGGGAVTFEPGGQLEWASPAFDSVDEVLAAADAELTDLTSHCFEGGVWLVSRGIDPVNGQGETELGLASPRYARMERHFRRWAPHGVRMMRQTAALHVNLDFGSDPDRRWKAATALVPYLIAIFANSARYAGRDTGHRSFRAAQWRALEPSRTGVLPATGAVEGLLQRAMGAPDFLTPDADGMPEPFGMRMAGGRATRHEWIDHLSTFFHEVRPRGYLEFRSIDSLPPRWLAAPLVFLVGLLYDARATDRVLASTFEPHPSLVEAAGRQGLTNRDIAAEARRLFSEALEGAARLGSDRVGPEALARAERFFVEFTERGRDPASADDGPGSEAPFVDDPTFAVPLEYGS